MIGGRVGGRERRAEVQRLGDVHDPTQGAPVAETTPMAESMHRYAPKPLCFVHLLRSPRVLQGGDPVTEGRGRQLTENAYQRVSVRFDRRWA